jgi:hypothetical protein
VTSLVPFSGLIDRVLSPFPYPFSEAVKLLFDALDLLALGGIIGCLIWAFYRAFRRAWSPLSVAIYLCVILTMILAGEAWTEINGFGRTVTPLLFLSALDGMYVGSILPTFAMLALDPRIGLETGVIGLVRKFIR